jgi:beta-lactam-binding protein with PASTA domain
VPEQEEEEDVPADAPEPEPLVVAAAATGPSVPDLIGLTSREAIARLTHLGVEPRLYGLGRVEAQEPPPGTPLPLGDAPCRIWLASPATP